MRSIYSPNYSFFFLYSLETRPFIDVEYGIVKTFLTDPADLMSPNSHCLVSASASYFLPIGAPIYRIHFVLVTR